MTALTRGPLPPRVYWTRRLMVFGTAILLVFGLARLLIGGSDASSAPEPQAVQAAASEADQLPATDLPPPPGTTRDAKAKKQDKTDKNVEPTKAPLPAPSGECADEDIAATPEIERAEAGGQIRIMIALRTIESEACTWRVSPESLTLKITSGKDDIWSSRECPRAVAKQDVVVRRETTREVPVIWSGRRSDDECSRQTQWALPGWYHVAVAALAGEPSDLQFELVRPKAEVVTESPDPKGGKNRDRDDDSSDSKNDDKNNKNDNKPKHR